MLYLRRLARPIVLSAAVTWSALASGQENKTRPNILIVLTDDQGYGDFSCHGNPILKNNRLLSGGVDILDNIEHSEQID